MIGIMAIEKIKNKFKIKTRVIKVNSIIKNKKIKNKKKK